MQEIIFWKNHPAAHDERFYQAMMNYYQVRLVCDTPTPQHRIISSGWSGRTEIETIFLSEQSSPKQFIHHFIEEHTNSIHVLCGLRGCLSVRLAFSRLLHQRNSRLLFSLESPTKTTGIKKFAQTLIYRRLLSRCRKKTAALFAMGEMGKRAYINLGFPEEKIFPVMYSYPGEYPELPPPTRSSLPLKLVFAGEAVPAKGVILLLEAVKSFTSSEVQLTFIGSDPLNILKNAILLPAWKGKIRSLGVIPNTRMIEELSQHDLLVLPSFNDGWGMVVTEALIAGIGSIVTDACGAQDIPLFYNTGLVIPAQSQKELNNALYEAVHNPEKILLWKQNARLYRDKTRPEVTAQRMDLIIKTIFRDHPPVSEF